MSSGAFLERSGVVCDPSDTEVAWVAEGSSTWGDVEEGIDWYSGAEGSSTSGFGDKASRTGLVEGSSTCGFVGFPKSS